MVEVEVAKETKIFAPEEISAMVITYHDMHIQTLQHFILWMHDR